MLCSGMIEESITSYQFTPDRLMCKCLCVNIVNQHTVQCTYTKYVFCQVKRSHMLVVEMNVGNVRFQANRVLCLLKFNIRSIGSPSSLFAWNLFHIRTYIRNKLCMRAKQQREICTSACDCAQLSGN